MGKILMRFFSLNIVALFGLSMMGCGAPSLSKWRVGDQFSERVMLVDADSQGNIWALRNARIDPSDYEYARYIEKYDVTGTRVLSIAESSGAQFRTFAVHPSGELTVVEVRKRLVNPAEHERASCCNIWFKRLRSDGSLLLETPLRDAGTADEKLYYEFDWLDDGNTRFTHIETWDRGVDSDGSTVCSLSNGEILLAQGERAFLRAGTYGHKLYHLDEDLGVDWSLQVMPWTGVDTNLSSAEVFTVDEHGHTFVASTFFAEEIFVWEKHFQRRLTKETEASSLFVAQYDASGKLVDARLFGREANFRPAGISARNGIITVGGSSRIEGKFDEPNHTRERDLLFLRAVFATGQVLDYKQIHLQRDDLAIDFKVDENGHGFFAGTNDYVQVDTNSWVEFGQAFVLKVDEHGDTLKYFPLREERHTEITSISLQRNGDVVFGGSFNGPITHSADSDAKQGFKWGMLGVLKSE